MDAVAEPHLFQVLLKGDIVLVGLATTIVTVNFLKGLANHQVVLAVLVKEDVTAVKGSLGEVID